MFVKIYRLVYGCKVFMNTNRLMYDCMYKIHFPAI
jgi:hypothetical protein